MGPGPVVTEFERKVYAEDAEKMDLSGTEEKIFPKKVFTSLAQRPEEVC